MNETVNKHNIYVVLILGKEQNDPAVNTIFPLCLSCWITELISSDIANICTTNETSTMAMHAGSSQATRLAGLILFSGGFI